MGTRASHVLEIISSPQQFLPRWTGAWLGSVVFYQERSEKQAVTESVTSVPM